MKYRYEFKNKALGEAVYTIFGEEFARDEIEQQMPDFCVEQREIELVMNQKISRELIRIGDEEAEFNNERKQDE